MPRYRVTFSITYPVYGKNKREGFRAAGELFSEDYEKADCSEHPDREWRKLMDCEMEDLGDCEQVQTMDDAETVQKMLKDKEKK